MLCDSGRHVILVADGNKLGTQRVREFATVDDVDVLITDVPLGDPMRDRFEGGDVRVVDNQLVVE